MSSTAFSAALLGIEGYVTRIHAESKSGSSAFTIVGLSERNTTECRVRSAIIEMGYTLPANIFIDVSPADIRKDDTACDLSVALAILAMDGQIRDDRLGEFVVIGALMSSGDIHAAHGVLPLVLSARQAGFKNVIVPAWDVEEATLVEGVKIYGARHLLDAINILHGGATPSRHGMRGISDERAGELAYGDFADVFGQQQAKRAFEIAAAGGHNVLLRGAAGCGKTMLSRRFASILPPMTSEEAVEVTTIQSIAGLLDYDSEIARIRPLRFPHHTVSLAALLGGRAKVAQPGEVTLAHRGVLYLADLPAFSRAALEALVPALDEGTIDVMRPSGEVPYPAGFQLIASMNPCPCGAAKPRSPECQCKQATLAEYFDSIPTALLDHIDVHLAIARVPFDGTRAHQSSESSATVRARVIAARERQWHRFAAFDEHTLAVTSNADITPELTARFCTFDDAAVQELGQVRLEQHLSAPMLGRIIRIARTIADLACEETIGEEHITEALQFSGIDGPFTP